MALGLFCIALGLLETGSGLVKLGEADSTEI
jgi:hypothetical protein